MKNLIITDLHFGANHNNINYCHYQQNIFKNQIMPLINEGNISRLKIIGDIFDNKKTLDVYILNAIKDIFKQINIPIDIVLGNHDLYYSNSNTLTSVDSLKEFKNINIIKNVESITEHGKKIMHVPYLNTDESITNFISQVKSYNPDILYGHFDVNEFYLANNILIKKGFDISLLSNIPLVVLGHIHIKQSKKNIHYIGPPWDINWGDVFSPKGIYTIDNGTTELKYIEQRNKYFQYYNVNNTNYKGVITDITSNPNREFKFKLSESIDEFIDFIETKFEKPENIKSMIVADEQTNEDIDVDESLSVKEIIDEQIKENDDFINKDKTFEMLNYIETSSLMDIKNGDLHL